MCGDRDLAEDLVQETYLKALRSREGFRPGADLKVWMTTILRNSLRDHWRRGRFVDPSVRSDEMMLRARGRRDPGVDRTDELESALRRLPERQRTVLLLAYVEGWSHEDIRSVMGCPRGSVGVWIARAKKQLRKMIRP